MIETATALVSLPATAVVGPDPRECYVLQVTSRTGKVVVFLKLRDLFPECFFYIEHSPQLFPFRCLRDNGCVHSCMEKLVKRVKYVFDTFKDAQLLLLYFSWRDQPGSQRAGVFWRDFSEPRYMTFNRKGWAKMKEIGTVYSWRLPDNLFLT